MARTALLTLGLLVASGLGTPRAVAAPRPKPDPAAIREAIGDSSLPAERYVSARALTHYMTAVVARIEGDTATEIAELRLAALYDAENPHAQYELAREYLRLGDLRAARAAAAEALVLDPNHAPTLALMGRLELQSGNAERAVTTLRRAVSLVPAEAEPTALFIDALLSTGSLTAATAAADKLSHLATDASQQPVRETVASALAHVAESLARDGRNDLAERFLQRAAELEPDDTDRQIALARFYERRDRAAEAAECYARVTALSTERSGPALEAARLFLKANKPLRAAGYVPLLAQEPKGSAPLLRLGQMLEDNAVVEEAIRAYDAAALASAGWSEPLVRAARLLEGLGKFPEAANRYRHVSEADDLHGEAQARAELCDLRSKDPRRHEAELIRRLQALTKHAPAIPEAFDLLARTLADRHHLTEAEGVARDALTRWPDRAESLQSLGRVLLQEKQSESFDVLEKVAVLLPASAEAQVDLAEAALLAGHADAAAAAVARAQSQLANADSKETQQRLTRVSTALTNTGKASGRSLRANRR